MQNYRKGDTMQATIKFNFQRLKDFQNFLTLLYHCNYNWMNYAEFWSIGNILKKVAKVCYNANFDNKKSYAIKLQPDEIQSFIFLVSNSENLLNQTPYYNAMFLDIAGQLQKHATEMEHKKQIFIDQQNLTIPKQLTNE